MLEIKIATPDEINSIEDILKEHGLNTWNLEGILPNCMITYDNKIPVAAAGYTQLEDIALLEFVAVRGGRHGEYLGDGIVKALLNLADRKGIKRMFVSTEKSDLFFEKVGMKKTCLFEVGQYKELLIRKGMDPKSCIFEAVLPDFFLKACRSNK